MAWRALRRSPTPWTVPRLAWEDAAGRTMVEMISVTGMNHGTPLATGGADGLGAAGPFMLEVGSSSMLRLAQRWGIAVAATAGLARRNAGPRDDQPRRLRMESKKPDPRSAATPHDESGIGKVISDALKAAGLVR